MSNAIRRFVKTDVMADVVIEIRRNGVAIIESLIEPHVVDGLLARLTDEFEGQKPGGGGFFGNGKKSATALFGRGSEFSEALLLNESLLEVADGILLPDVRMAASAPPPDHAFYALDEEAVNRVIDPDVGPNCHHYRVNASVAMQVCKGGANQPLHRDEWRYRPYMRRDPNGPELTVAFLIAGVDFTEDNGATRFVPGSNKWSEERVPAESETVQALMPKGSAALWLGSVYHGFSASRVDEPRTGLIFSYVVDHLTQEENQFTAVPWETAMRLPRRAQQLIGYRCGKSLNFIEGLDDADHPLTPLGKGSD